MLIFCSTPLLLQHDNAKAHIFPNPNVTTNSTFEPQLAGAATAAGSNDDQTVIKAASSNDSQKVIKAAGLLGPGMLLGAAATAGMALYGEYRQSEC